MCFIVSRIIVLLVGGCRCVCVGGRTCTYMVCVYVRITCVCIQVMGSIVCNL